VNAAAEAGNTGNVRGTGGRVPIVPNVAKLRFRNIPFSRIPMQIITLLVLIQSITAASITGIVQGLTQKASGVGTVLK
jgi:hypothetical protein